MYTEFWWVNILENYTL